MNEWRDELVRVGNVVGRVDAVLDVDVVVVGRLKIGVRWSASRAVNHAG